MELQVPSKAFNELTAEFSREFIDAQNEIEVDAKFLALGFKKLARATKRDTFKGQVTTYNEDGKPIRTEDKILYSRPLSDNPTQLKAQQILLNSRGVPTTSPTHQTNISQASEVNIMGAIAQIMAENGADIDD